MTAISKLPPISRAEAPPVSEPVRKPIPSEREEFSEVLGKALVHKEPLEFSAHAQARLLQHQIRLTPTQMERLNRGVGQAAEKGAKDSLVLLDNLALLVNIRNRVVITAMDGARMRDNVFTQIDSAVIA
jgi:flagellar operon protein